MILKGITIIREKRDGTSFNKLSEKSYIKLNALSVLDFIQ